MRYKGKNPPDFFLSYQPRTWKAISLRSPPKGVQRSSNSNILHGKYWVLSVWCFNALEKIKVSSVFSYVLSKLKTLQVHYIYWKKSSRYLFWIINPTLGKLLACGHPSIDFYSPKFRVRFNGGALEKFNFNAMIWTKRDSVKITIMSFIM